MLVTRQLTLAIDIHSIFFLWKSMATVNCLVTTFFKISSFVFNRTKKLMQDFRTIWG